MLRRPGATTTRKRNCLGINVFLLLLAGNERENRKQKLRAAPAALAPRLPPGRRALQAVRVAAARPQRARAPRATSPPRPRRAAELAAGRRGPGCGRRLSAALVSAVLCALLAGSAHGGLPGAPRTQVAAGRRGPELPPGGRPSRAAQLVVALPKGTPGVPQGAWGAAGPSRRNPAGWWRGAGPLGRPGRRSRPGRDGTGRARLGGAPLPRGVQPLGRRLGHFLGGRGRSLGEARRRPVSPWLPDPQLPPRAPRLLRGPQSASSWMPRK